MPRRNLSVGSTSGVKKVKKPRKTLRQMISEEYSNLMRHSYHSNNNNSVSGGVTATSRKRKKPIPEYHMNNFTNWFRILREKRKKQEKKNKNKNYIVVNGIRRYGTTSRVSSPGSSISTAGTWRHSAAK